MATRGFVSRAPITALIVNMLTGTVININHVPEELGDSNSSNFSETSIPGRSSPILGYDSSGPRSITFTLQLHDDYCEKGILQTVHELKALTYPEYGTFVMPPKCYVRIGNTLRFIGVCSDVSVSWKKPYRDGVFVYADVSLSFKSVVEIPLRASEVEWGEG